LRNKLIDQVFKTPGVSGVRAGAWSGVWRNGSPLDAMSSAQAANDTVLIVNRLGINSFG
jgi:hypothetical protein